MMIFVAALSLPAQQATPDVATSRSSALEELGRGFDNIEIGMTKEQTEAALMRSGFFRYTGKPDISFRPGSDDPILYVEGLQYVREAYFQFRDDRLYSIIVVLNTNLIDYGTFFRNFRERFGDPLTINPTAASWENGVIRLRLEKPLSVQYLDLAVFNRITEEAQIQTSAGEYSRDLLLQAF